MTSIVLGRRGTSTYIFMTYIVMAYMDGWVYFWRPGLFGSETDMDKFLDLSREMNQAPYTVQINCQVAPRQLAGVSVITTY